MVVCSICGSTKGVVAKVGYCKECRKTVQALYRVKNNKDISKEIERYKRMVAILELIEKDPRQRPIEAMREYYSKE